MSESQQIIYDTSKKRRVKVFRTANGSYSFVEECFSGEPHEQCWLPMTKGRSVPICDSIETALREAEGRVDWLSDVATRSD